MYNCSYWTGQCPLPGGVYKYIESFTPSRMGTMTCFSVTPPKSTAACPCTTATQANNTVKIQIVFSLKISPFVDTTPARPTQASEDLSPNSRCVVYDLKEQPRAPHVDQHKPEKISCSLGHSFGR